MKRILLAMLALTMSVAAMAAIDTYEFDTEEQRARFYQLSNELRCPKCQNQNIADSNSPIATDLRREIFRMLDEGQSNEQITEFMVMRYGEFVRYKPALTAQTAVLWFRPGVLSAGWADWPGGHVASPPARPARERRSASECGRAATSEIPVGEEVAP